jgi:hypothetical protein
MTSAMSFLRERRKATKPRPAKPTSIIIHVEDYGLGVMAPNRPSTSPLMPSVK